ncbi:MAG: FAD-binding protein, partial [Ruminiclostridium sp.]|nr:FAD-binding protein [Ruminiclostridium sp.]
MINILGAGIAGLSAALTLAEKGIRCRLISAQQSERAQSVLAEGGINAALNTMGEGDTPELHFEETMKSGCYLADPNAVRALTENAPEVVMRLAALGVPFNRNNDGSLTLRSFGGQKKKRTAFAKSSTGKMIMTALIDAVRKYEVSGLVERYPRHSFVCLLTENGRCAGVRVKDDYTGKHLDFAGTVITALGGLNGFFPSRTTGTVTNSGTAAAVMFAQGVKFANLEMIQYHPTTIARPGKNCLISEAARGEGGRLYAERGGFPWYFMEEKYPSLGNLMPRDVVSREIYFVSRDPSVKNGTVFLDMTGITEDVWKNRLSDLREQIMHWFPLDPKKDPVPVKPSIHYFMGGILVNDRHEASLDGLYAAGECACQYHGANRLGGNSMLGAVFGGMTAAKNA